MNCVVLTKVCTQSYIDHVQNTKTTLKGIKQITHVGTGVGFSSHDEGVRKVCEIFRGMAGTAVDSQLITADVSAMDWSLGGTSLLTWYKMMLDCSGKTQTKDKLLNPSIETVEIRKRAIWAFGYATHHPMYIIGNDVVIQVCHAIPQTGAAITTWMGDKRFFPFGGLSISGDWPV